MTLLECTVLKGLARKILKLVKFPTISWELPLSTHSKLGLIATYQERNVGKEKEREKKKPERKEGRWKSKED